MKIISGGGALRDLHQLADTGETEPASERNAGRGTGNDGDCERRNHFRIGSEQKRLKALSLFFSGNSA